MQPGKLKVVILAILLCVVSMLFAAPNKNIKFRIIDLEKVSRYHEDRIIFQHVELDHVQYKPSVTDNSMATLLIIRDKKMYLFKDGYDNPIEVAAKKSAMEMENKLVDDIWFNKVNSAPDYLQVTDRRVEIQRSVAKAADPKKKDSKKGDLEENYKKLYLKVRDNFIDRHVKIFRLLMINRKDSGLQVSRSLIPQKMHETKERYKTVVSAKTINGVVFYAEDADGDNITETFYVKIADGFHWGFKSGPNVILIYNNKQKDLQAKIGKLASEAYYGTKEEKDNLKKTFPTEKTLLNMVDSIYSIDKDLEAVLKRKN